MKRSLKIILALLLCLSFIFGFAACGALTENTGVGLSSENEASYTEQTGSDDAYSIPEREQVGFDSESPDDYEGYQDENDSNHSFGSTNEDSSEIDEYGSYFSKDDVSMYIHTYGHLPSNFITKKEAKNLGWEGGSVEEYAKGKAIGGDRFGNYEKLLPEGHNYFECDIDTDGQKSRGAKRIIFSDDGLIYYTEDHYESFELLYDSME